MRFEHLEHRVLLAADFDYRRIEIDLAGKTGEETIELQIDGQAVATFSSLGGDYNSRVYERYSYVHPTDVRPDQVRVAFVNDGTSSGGIDKNVRVGGIVLGGLQLPSNGPGVFTTGTWVSGQGPVAGYLETDTLYINGYFQYASAADPVLRVDAAGKTGEEQMRLLVGGKIIATADAVGGDYNGRDFLSYEAPLPAGTTLADIEVAFTNDGLSSGGLDKNLRIDGITLDGVTYQSEGPGVFSTAQWVAGQGRVPGYYQTESLFLNGSFTYEPADAEELVVYAAGATGEERLAIQVDGKQVATVDAVAGDYYARQFVACRAPLPAGTTIDQVRVAFVNDGRTAEDRDKNLRVDRIELGGVVYQSEAPGVYSTGVWEPSSGITPGFKQSEILAGNGYFQYAGRSAGALALGGTQFVVDENDATATVTVVRTGGSDGRVTLDYTTVDASAVAGLDYVAQAGVLVLNEGQTSAEITIALLPDALTEGPEAFNVAADRVTGGAFLGAPRTATVTIIDNQQPAESEGNGLLGSYYTGVGFNQLQAERTDTTIDFDWGASGPDTGVGADGFSVRWTGRVEPLYSETYTFQTTTDDGVRLWVDGQLLIDQFVNQAGGAVHTGQITLEAGRKYDLVMEYFEQNGSASAQLAWSSASQPLEVVPRAQLYSETPLASVGQFISQPVVTGLTQPTAISFAAGDRMFIAQKNGLVRLYEAGQLLAEPFLDIRDDVNNVRDRGLLGLEVHPNFPAEPYVYVLYTYDPPEAEGQTGLAGRDQYGNRVSRLVRYTADAANNYRTAEPGSGVVLLGKNSTWENINHPEEDGTVVTGEECSCDGVADCLPTDSQSHSVGGLDWGPDGSLYVTHGDGASYGRVDPRAIKVQDLDHMTGKVFRIDPMTGEGLADNPFFTGDAADDRSKVFNYGLRNPFRVAIDPASGLPFVGDVGWNTWEEINVGVGANFGWPFYEGGNDQNLKTGGYRDLAEAQAFYASNPDVTAPVWSRSHAAGGVAISLGDFYTGGDYPELLNGSLFFTDYADGLVRAISIDAGGAVVEERVVTQGQGAIVEMTMGPDGRMYYVDLFGVVGRFEFQPAGTSGMLTTSVAIPNFESEPESSESGAVETQSVQASPSDDALLLLLDDDQPVEQAFSEGYEASLNDEEEPVDEAGLDAALVGMFDEEF